MLMMMAMGIGGEQRVGIIIAREREREREAWHGSISAVLPKRQAMEVLIAPAKKAQAHLEKVHLLDDLVRCCTGLG